MFSFRPFNYTRILGWGNVSLKQLVVEAGINIISQVCLVLGQENGAYQLTADLMSFEWPGRSLLSAFLNLLRKYIAHCLPFSSQ
jgi:hypothetical protein